MMYTLSNLRGLYKAMKDAGITRYKWRFVRGPAPFEAIFIIEESPFELLLGAIGTRFGTTLQVHPGFRIDALLPTPDFYALCDALQLTRDPSRKFKPSDFFADLDANIPQTVDLKTGRVQPHDVITHRRNVEDADKRYFCGWEDNTKDGGHVSEGNLEKTRQAFGQRVYELCKKRNISSKWTDNPKRAQDYFDPS
jgi:hypothetical protein